MANTAPKIQGINLVGIGGRFARQIFSLPSSGATVGRESDNDLILTGSSISRRHAVLVHKDDAWALQDLGSANGSWVNGKRVQGETPLRHGDRIKFDRDEFMFVDADKNRFDTRGYRLAEKETVTLGKLVYTQDGVVHEVLLEEPTLTVGRDATNDIVLDLPGVSGSHCKIRSVDDEHTLVDLRSTNGTYLEGSDQRVDQVRLKPGMVFRVGAANLRFETEKVSRPKPSEPMAPLLFPAPGVGDVLLPIIAAFVVVLTVLFALLLAVPPPAPGDLDGGAIGAPRTGTGGG